MKQPIFWFGVALLSGTMAAAPGQAGTVSGEISNVKLPATIALQEPGKTRIYRVRTNASGGYSVFLPVGKFTVKVNNKPCGQIRSYDVPVRQDIRCK